jgi:hypothetical protein
MDFRRDGRKQVKRLVVTTKKLLYKEICLVLVSITGNFVVNMERIAHENLFFTV